MTDERNTVELREFITFKLARLQSRLNAQSIRMLKAHCDLSLTEWRVLAVTSLLERGTLSDIVRETELDKGQLSRGISSLVQRGLLSSHVNPSDQRQNDLVLTREGQTLHDRMLPKMRSRQTQLTAGISADDMAATLRVIGALDAASSSLPDT